MRRILFCIALFGVALVQAQPRSINFDHLMVENGMPENYAIDLVQDKNGYIWCGTQRGLMRFDGYNVKVYKQPVSADSTSQINSITSVFIDRKAVLWAGTYGKYLLRYNPGTDDFVVFRPDSTANNAGSAIHNILDDAQNNLWFRTYSLVKDAYLLERFDPGTGKFISYKFSSKEKAGIPADDFIGISSDRAGRVWINTDNGIYTYDEKTDKFTGYFVSPDPAKNKFSLIYMNHLQVRVYCICR